ncbi:MAG: flagellar hook-basal body protein [Solirubrobacterales bacterium]|jgi:flagellar hook protein FlgE|nr:flagellar hook-basal body protein [Solirubrobacterales bacterium]
MMRAMYSAISGLKSNQTSMDVIANNLANVNTVAYKGSRTTFRDMLSQLQRGGAAQSTNGGFAGANSAQVGLGVTIGSIDKMMGGGALQTTSRSLDVGIQGEGWMRVGQVAGGTDPVATPTSTTAGTGWTTTNYTRAGNLNQNSNGYMTTTDGYYIVGKAADATTGAATATDNYLYVPPGATDVAIGEDGGVTFTPPAGYALPTGQYTNPGTGRVTAGYLSMSKFANEGGLDKVGSNRYAASAASGAAVQGTSGKNGFGTTVGGTLEMSNVDLATEFTSMITAQRGFQANSRVISTGDQMLQELVDLKR